MSDKYPGVDHAFLQRRAAKNKCVAVFAEPNTLQLDFDDQARPTLDSRLLAFVHEYFGLRLVTTWESYSGHGWHVQIETDKDMSFSTRLVLQAAFGSDPMREALGAIEADKDIDNVCLFKPVKE